MNHWRHALSTYTTAWLFVCILVVLNPCLLYCTMMRHGLSDASHSKTRVPAFLCQFTDAPTAPGQSADLPQHHMPGSTPLNLLASIAQVLREFLPQHSLIIIIPTLLLAFIGSSQSLRVPSHRVTPPTPPPRFAA